MTMSAKYRRRERGSGLIVVIMIAAFMLSIGMLLLTVTGTSPKASDSLRLQGLAFDAAEAGFNAAWIALNDAFNSGVYANFAGHYKTQFGGVDGFDDPTQPDRYFRSLTDDQIIQDCLDHPDPNVLFSSQTLATDPRCSYTVFLVSDEAPNTVAPNDNNALLVCIGRGPGGATKRLEIVLECPQ
jgi:hypothetical protein